MAGSSGSPPIKPYSMSAIKSKLLQPALTSHYICAFTPPSLVRDGKDSPFADFMKKRSGAGFKGAIYSNNQELIELSCSEASLPGSSLATNEINNDYTGVTERHAYRRIYDDRADFTFYVDINYYIIDYFENWIAFISGEDDLNGQVNSTFNYRVKFPKDYYTQNLYITKFDRDYTGRPLTYRFINAYPIAINSIPVSYDSSQLLKCTVSFTYSRYVISRTGEFVPQSEEPVQEDLNVPNKIRSSSQPADNLSNTTNGYFNQPVSPFNVDKLIRSGSIINPVTPGLGNV